MTLTLCSEQTRDSRTVLIRDFEAVCPWGLTDPGTQWACSGTSLKSGGSPHPGAPASGDSDRDRLGPSQLTLLPTPLPSRVCGSQGQERSWSPQPSQVRG